MALRPSTPSLNAALLAFGGITFRFDRPTEVDLLRIDIGRGATATGLPVLHDSTREIGSYPSWITQYTSPSGSTDNYYFIRLVDNNFNPGDWSNAVQSGTVANSGVWEFLYYLPPSGNTVTLETVPGLQLIQNTEYRIKVDPGLRPFVSGEYLPLQTGFESFFTSEYNPLYLSVQAIRLDIGPFISDIPDDTINRMIYKNSYWAFSAHPTTLEEPVPWYVYEYVRCSTELDLLKSQYTRVALQSGTSIKLGDFSVDCDATNFKNMIGPMIDELKKCVEAMDDMVVNGGMLTLTAASTVKAGADARRPIGMAQTQWNREPRNQPRGRPVGPWRR